MNVAIFARVSTTEQTAANQMPEIERLCAMRGWTITHRYVENGVSGAARERPELKRLLADAHAGHFQAVVVWALDRISRKGIAEVAGIIAKLDAAKVALVSVREPWADTSGPVRDLLIAVMSWVAAQERARLRERTLAGLARAKSQGIKLGRPSKHRGLIDAALARVASGESIEQAAKWAAVHPTTLRRYRAANS